MDWSGSTALPVRSTGSCITYTVSSGEITFLIAVFCNITDKLLHHYLRQKAHGFCSSVFGDLGFCWTKWENFLLFLFLFFSYLSLHYSPPVTCTFRVITCRQFGIELWIGPLILHYEEFRVVHDLLNAECRNIESHSLYFIYIALLVLIIFNMFRLAPAIALTAGASATVVRFFLVGPMAGTLERVFVDNCRDWWWADVLFASNFIDPPVSLGGNI